MEGHITLGTFYAEPYCLNDNEPHKRFEKEGWLFIIRDTNAVDELLTWDTVGEKLILRSPYIKRGWSEILRSKLVLGQKITVDGMTFTCRIPHLDKDLEACQINPWDCSHWIYDSKSPDLSFELNEWSHNVVPILGIDKIYTRLILEPHCPDLSQLVGQRIRLLSHTGIVTANLLDITDYDLICDNTKWLSGDVSKDWMLAKGNQTYIARNAVLNATAI